MEIKFSQGRHSNINDQKVKFGEALFDQDLKLKVILYKILECFSFGVELMLKEEVHT